jgi:hypothetical protein
MVVSDWPVKTSSIGATDPLCEPIATKRRSRA